jgi:hypothetical protein
MFCTVMRSADKDGLLRMYCDCGTDAWALGAHHCATESRNLDVLYCLPSPGNRPRIVPWMAHICAVLRNTAHFTPVDA